MELRTTKNVRPEGIQKIDSLALLARAQMGEIPLAALQNLNLNKEEVAFFLARELLFLHSAAEGAKMHSLAVLFYELHASLIDTANMRWRPNQSDKIIFAQQNSKRS